MPATVNSSKHTWQFFRAGGFDQVRLDSGADIACLDQLDQKLWVALACPTRGLEFDSKTLDLIDTDKDGRIRAPEILAAAKWACAMLKDPDELLKGSAALPLSAINDAVPEGKSLLSSARQILRNLGKAEAAAISVEDTADTVKIFAQTQFNGDGVLPADAAEDPAVKAVINDIIACLEGVPDRSGKLGITQEKADLFFASAQAYVAWQARTSSDQAVLPLGPNTTAAAATLKAVAPKIDDYFARSRLTSFDPRATAAVNRAEADYVALAAKELSIAGTELAAFPLARVEPGRPLPLVEGLNPGWRAPIAALNAQVIKPLLGEKTSLTETEWAALVAKFAAFDGWLAAKAGGNVEKLGLTRVQEILSGHAPAAISALIAQDKALEPEANAIANVDRLVRYNRDLHKLLNNFVSFRDFYRRREKAIFQAGTLYLDTRSCDLCVRVDDMARHGLMAHLSASYLAYCDLTRKATGEKMTIVAAFTGGDSDNLMVGRNGIFYDRKGQDWDATITKIVENPISIRQAFFAPYKRVMRWIEDQVAKRAAAADAATASHLTAAAGSAAPGTPPAPPPAPAKIDVGTIAAMGVAAGFITATMGALLQVFFGLGIWMPLGIIALILLISGPSMIIAFLKLRQRNLGPILDANGWAVNAKAKINIPFGGSLTRVAMLPPGSRRDLIDPYAESHKGRTVLITVLILLVLGWGVWFFGGVEYVRPGLLPPSSFVVGLQTTRADTLLSNGRRAVESKDLNAADSALRQLQDLEPKLTRFKVDSVYIPKIDALARQIAEARAATFTAPAK